MTEELELKYSIDDPRAVRSWLDATFPPRPGQDWRSFSITDRYFDTPDGVLAAAGYGARLRRAHADTTLTMKSDIRAAEGALHDREELEAPATRKLDAAKWPESVAKERLLSVIGDRRLVERFAVRQRRRERPVSVGGAVLLASIDTGKVDAVGADAGAITQFELEWRSGRRTGFERAARAAEASGICRAEPRSKLAIAAGMAAAASKVYAGDSYAEAGRKVLRRHLLRMLERERPTRAGDELALKQMRVATRRMRATWRVFGGRYRKQIRCALTDELRVIGRTLGAVRDLDVLLAGIATRPALGEIADHWRARRQTAFAELVVFLDDQRFGKFVNESLALTSARDAGVRRRRTPASVAVTAPVALRAAFAELMRAGATAAATDDVTMWHALRIEGRRFRYSLEAFVDVLAEPPVAALIRRVTRLQDELGAMNDASVAVAAVSRWLDDGGETVPEPARAAATRYVARQHAAVARRRARIEPLWNQLSDPTAAQLLDHALGALTQS